MAVNLSPVGGVAAQFFDNDGNVLSGGKIYTYAAGSTTPQSTYTTGAGNIAHANPIILDSAGRVPTGEIWLTDGSAYKFVIKDANDTLIGTYDNIVGINSNFINYTSSQEIQTATAGQTVFTLTTMAYQPGTNSLSVFVDGVNQYGPGAQYAYTETSSTSVTFASGLHVGASVKFTTAVINNIGGVSASQISFTGFKGQVGNVQNLADDDGEDWIGFQPSGTGAVARSGQDKLRDWVSAADFGMSPSATASANKTALTAAMAASLQVYIPAGTYNIDGDLMPRLTNQKIFGASEGAAYNMSYSATKLVFQSGTTGFNLETYFGNPSPSYSGGPATEYVELNDLFLDCNGIVQNGITFMGTKFFRNISIENFTSIGIWGKDYLNASIIDNCNTFNYNSRGAPWGNPSQFTGWGLVLDGSQSTCTFVKNSRFRCGEYGIILRGFQGGSIRDTVIESNSNVGLVLEASDGKGMVRNIFDNLWLENNSDYATAAGFYQMAIRNYATTSTWYAKNNIFVNCNFSAPGNSYQYGILVDANVKQTKFQNCFFPYTVGNSSIQIAASEADGTEFINCAGIVTENYAGGMWGHFTVPNLGGSRIKRSSANKDVYSVGDTPPTFALANGQTITMVTDSVGVACTVLIYDGSTGQGAMFFVTNPYAALVSDTTGGLFVQSSSPAVGKIGLYADSGGIKIVSNLGSSRDLKVNVVGARVASLTWN